MRSAPRYKLALCGVLACLLAPVAEAGSPRIDYMLECQGCHLADGSGSPQGVPALGDFVANFLTVEGGREFLVQVPGSATSPLSDARLAAVLNWMLLEFGPREIAELSTPYTAAEVALLRASPLTDVEGTRRGLVSSIEERK
jgi:hypothetical protein